MRRVQGPLASEAAQAIEALAGTRTLPPRTGEPRVPLRLFSTSPTTGCRDEPNPFESLRAQVECFSLLPSQPTVAGPKEKGTACKVSGEGQIKEPETHLRDR